jgi:very-short-patch-repair endonuclease
VGEQDSLHQREVVRALQTLGLEPHVEHQDPATGYMIDVAVFPSAEARLAVEVDGPLHVTRTAGALLGTSRMKQRHLEGAGWRAVRVPSREWEAVQGSAAQRAYLRALLGLEGPL